MKNQFTRYCMATVGTGLMAAILTVSAFSMPVWAQPVFPSPACPADTAEIEMNDKLTNYSLYYESFKNKDYESALPYLKWILNCAPAFGGPNRLNDNNFERAVETYAALAEAAPEAEMKSAYLDTALYLFDTAVPTLKDAGAEFNENEWLLNKGRFIQEHAADLPADVVDQAGQIYESVYDTDPSQFGGDQYLAYYVDEIIKDYVRKDDYQGALEFMDKVEGQNSGVADVMAVLSGHRDVIAEGMDPAERVEILEDQVAKNPEDTGRIADLCEAYIDLGDRTQAASCLERQLALSPTCRTYMQLGNMRLNDGEASEAITAFEQALGQSDCGELGKEIYYNMGVAAAQLEQLSKARTYYRQALEQDRNYGLALIGIGDLYASAVRSCSSEMGREDQAVYWLAVDYYERAKQVDPSVANAANQKINTYRRYFPDAEALFFMNWNAGDTYQVNQGCYAWINESTTVRAPS